MHATPPYRRLARLSLGVLTLFMLPAAARALLIYDYAANPGLYERFDSDTFPSAPVENATFFLAGLDLSGIGWRSGSSFGGALVSPQHFLTAAHVAPAAGATLNFVNTDGALKSYTVHGTQVIQHPNGQNTDLVVVRLTAPIPSVDQVAFYATLLFPSAADYLGLSLVMFGAGQRAGINTIAAVQEADLLPFGSGNGVADNFITLTTYDPITGSAQGQGGDSGSPTFALVNGQLALLAVNSAIGTLADDTPFTVGIGVPFYAAALNNVLQLDGYSLGAFVLASPIPEPGAAAAGMAFVTLVFAALRRRRRA